MEEAYKKVLEKLREAYGEDFVGKAQDEYKDDIDKGEYASFLEKYGVEDESKESDGEGKEEKEDDGLKRLSKRIDMNDVWKGITRPSRHGVSVVTIETDGDVEGKPEKKKSKGMSDLEKLSKLIDITNKWNKGDFGGLKKENNKVGDFEKGLGDNC